MRVRSKSSARLRRSARAQGLRIAMASLGARLVGDPKYGAPEPLPDRSVTLHALRLSVPHPTRDETVEVEVAPPDLDVWRSWSAIL